MARAYENTAKPSFRRDERGVTAVLFALMVMPLLALTFTAIDMGRAYYARGKLQAAADSAAGAGAAMLGSAHEAIGETIAAYLKANTRQDRKLPPYEVVIAPNDVAVTVRVKDSIATTAAGIVGIPTLDISVESIADRPAPVIVPPAEEAGSGGSGAPALPAVPATNRAPTPNEMRQAETAIREVLENIERDGDGGDREIRRLLQAMRNRR